MDPKDVSRYVRPSDVPQLDRDILDPIIRGAARDLADESVSEAEWHERIERALHDGELLIVIDDKQKRVGLVRSDRPPFLGLDDDRGPAPTVSHADPLDLKRWEMKGDS